MDQDEFVPVNYSVVSYKELSGEGLITMILIRKTMSFGFNYGMKPWVKKFGVQNTLVDVGTCLSGSRGWFAVFVKCEKRLRRATARTYWKYIEKDVIRTH